MDFDWRKESMYPQTLTMHATRVVTRSVSETIPDRSSQKGSFDLPSSEGEKRRAFSRGASCVLFQAQEDRYGAEA